jgi:hypothetical protein
MNEHTASATIGRRVLLGAASTLLAAWPVWAQEAFTPAIP